jgi:hypothetical protein
MHQHDYKMEFHGDGLDFHLVCACGDVAPDLQTASKRMKESKISLWRRIKSWWMGV